MKLQVSKPVKAVIAVTALAVAAGGGWGIAEATTASTVTVAPASSLYGCVVGPTRTLEGNYTSQQNFISNGGCTKIGGFPVTIASGSSPTPTPTPTPTQTTPTPTPTPTQAASAPSWDPSGSYSTIFDDEFNGTSLDTSKWTPGWFGTGTTGPVNTAETTLYSSANVSESGGDLHLALNNTSSDGGKHPNTGSIVTTNPSDGRSSGGFQFTYGSVEWRIYVPPTSDGSEIANWPAAWIVGQDWPADGEFDVMEGIHGNSQWSVITKTSGNPFGTPTGNYSGWHTFGVQWLPSGSVTFYYDGKAVSTGQTASNTTPMCLILDNTQGSYGGPNLFPSTMLVDWVRVWQPA